MWKAPASHIHFFEKYNNPFLFGDGMCLAIPGKIIEIKGDVAIVKYPGMKTTAKIVIGNYKVGDYVFVSEKIITGGLYQYAAAIKKVVGWNWRIQKQKHIIDSGIGKNWFIERLNREIKRRIKWFSTFQSLDGANAFFGLWFYHHNTQYVT